MVRHRKQPYDFYIEYKTSVVLLCSSVSRSSRDFFLQLFSSDTFPWALTLTLNCSPSLFFFIAFIAAGKFTYYLLSFSSSRSRLHKDGNFAFLFMLYYLVLRSYLERFRHSIKICWMNEWDTLFFQRRKRCTFFYWLMWTMFSVSLFCLSY